MLLYSSLNSKPKISLPTVEGGWNGNRNIIRDPPKSITTRKIDKVGSTSAITEEIDASANRIFESISYYAKGVNPAVSVSYSNANGSNNMSSGSSEAFLPYRIMKDGAFRPPVFRQEDLLPLSRQRRAITSVPETKQFIDFSKQLTTHCLEKNTIRNDSKLAPTVNANITSSLTNDTIIEPFEIKYVIKNSMNINTHTSLSTTDRTEYTNLTPSYAITNPLTGEMHTNISELRDDTISNTLNHTNYITNLSQYATNTNIEGLRDDTVLRNGDVLNHANYITNLSQYETNTNIEGIRDDNVLRNGDIDKNNYTRTSDNITVNSNFSGTLLYDKNIDVNKIKTRTPIDTRFTTPIVGITKNEYIHADIEKGRKMDIIPVKSQATQNIHTPLLTTDKIIKPTLVVNASVNSMGAQFNKHTDNLNKAMTIKSNQNHNLMKKIQSGL